MSDFPHNLVGHKCMVRLTPKRAGRRVVCGPHYKSVTVARIVQSRFGLLAVTVEGKGREAFAVNDLIISENKKGIT